MKKTLFSKGLYIEGLRRLRVFGFIALALMTVIQLAYPITSYFNYLDWLQHYRHPGDVFSPDIMSFDIVTLSVPFTAALVTPIMVLILFSVFNKRSSSDFYHALPYTRACIFISNMAAVFTWVIGIAVVAGGIGLIAYLAFPQLFTVVFDGALDLLFTYLAFMLISAGVCSLAVSMTGTMLSNIAVSVLILILPRFIMTVITMEIGNLAEYLALDYLSILSPSMNVYVGTLFELFFEGDLPNYFANAAADAYTCIIGILYLAAALFIFIRRKSEVATQPALTRGVQATVRILLTMVIGIFSVILFIEGELAGCIVLTLISVVAYFAYELITTHRWKNCLRALPGLAIVFGISILCGAVMLGIPKISETYRPEAGDVDSVRFVDDGNDERDWFAVGTDKIEFTDEEIIKIVCNTVCENMEQRDKNIYHGYGYYTDGTYEETESYVYRTVAIKSGLITRYRNIAIKQSEHDKILTFLENHEEYIKLCKTLPKYATNTLWFYPAQDGADDSFYAKVFETLQKEIDSLSYDDWYKIANNMEGYDFGTYFEISYDTDTYDSKYVNFNIPAECFPKTFNMLLKTNEIRYKDRYEALSEFIMSLDKGDELYEYSGISVQVCIPDGEGSLKVYSADSSYHNYGGEDPAKGWASDPYKDAYKTLMEKTEGLEKKPSAEEGYVYVEFNYDTARDYNGHENIYESEYGQIYLPLPDDLDPEAAGFYPRSEDENYYHYYEG